MTPTEMRELDAWIAGHVMGLALCERHPAILEPNEFVLSIPSKIVRARIEGNPTINFEPTTDPAAAMEVLKKCGEKCCVTLEYTPRNTLGKPQWMVARLEPEEQCEVDCSCSETLETAIALFAKKLFTK